MNPFNSESKSEIIEENHSLIAVFPNPGQHLIILFESQFFFGLQSDMHSIGTSLREKKGSGADARFLRMCVYEIWVILFISKSKCWAYDWSAISCV